MNAWQFIKQEIQCMRLQPGQEIETTLLGRVPWRINGLGLPEGFVPDHLQDRARDCGLVIVRTDLRRNVYVLKLLPYSWPAADPM